MGVRIRRHLQDQNIAEEDYITRIRQIFLKFDIDHGGTLSKDEFLELLASIDIYMTHESFDLLWAAIDYDVSGECALLNVLSSSLSICLFVCLRVCLSLSLHVPILSPCCVKRKMGS